MAVENSQWQAMDCLLAAGASPDIVDEHHGMTLLQAACFYEQLQVVTLLLKHGASIQGPAVPLLTPHPLRLAIGLGESCTTVQKAMVSLLLDHGANVNAEDSFGNTPFLTACHNGNLEMVQLFVEKGVDLQHQNRKGLTPLELAIAFHHCEMARHIVAEFHRRHIAISRTCLLAAIFDNCASCFQLCLDQKLNISDPFPERKNVTPLLFAIQHSEDYFKGVSRYNFNRPRVTDRRLDMVKLLIESGAKRDNLWKGDLFYTECATRSEDVFLYLVCAFGFHFSESSFEAELFRNFVCDGLIHSSRLLCQGGYTPSAEDCMYMKDKWRAIEGGSTRRVLQEIKDCVEGFRTQPRTLQNCCVRSVRKSLHTNIICNVERLHLPAQIKQMITLQSEVAAID